VQKLIDVGRREGGRSALGGHFPLLFSPPENDSFRKDFCFMHDVLFFFRARDLRDAWADRLEILHDGQY